MSFGYWCTVFSMGGSHHYHFGEFVSCEVRFYGHVFMLCYVARYCHSLKWRVRISRTVVHTLR